MTEIKTKKSSVISDVRYACAVGATNTVVAIKDAVPIANCSPGCQLKTTAMLTFENGFQGSVAAGGGTLPSSNRPSKSTTATFLWFSQAAPANSSATMNLATQKNALFFEISTPSSETLIVNRSHIGYKVALQFLERIYSASVGGRPLYMTMFL